MLRTADSSGDNELDSSLCEPTVTEVKKGFLGGPLSASDLPVDALLTETFPVKQKNKVRPIGDYNLNLVNQSATQSEGLRRAPLITSLR